MSIDKFADFNGAEVEVIQYAKGWYQILLLDGTTKKVRKADLSNMRDTSNLDAMGPNESAPAVGETVNAAQESVAVALAEQSKYSAADTTTLAEDKNHPSDSFDDESRTFKCGICEAEFLTAASLTAHKDEEHDAPVVAPRPGSLAASLLNRDRAREVSVELCQKSATKAEKKAPRVAKVNLLTVKTCPECGESTEQGKTDEGAAYNTCDTCGWEHHGTVTEKPKLEPKLDRYVVGKGTTESGRPTIDRDDAVAQVLRSLSLAETYAYVARVMLELEIETIGSGSRKMETGEADFRARYGHLNPGMQRMNLGNVLRGVLNRLGIEPPKV